MHSPSCKIIQNKGGLRTKGYLKKSYEGKPLISIITVVFNGEQHLEETIQSVINQTYENVEYIIIDGGSSDGTLDIIKKYEDKIDYWVSEKDEGISDAFNKGIKISQGELIGLLNSDDWYEVDAISSIVCSLKRNMLNQKIILYGDLFFPEKNKIQKGDQYFFFKILFIMPLLNHPSCFVTRATYKQVGLFNIKLKLAMDFDFLRRAYLANTKFIYIDKLITNMRLTGISNQYKRKAREEVLSLSSSKIISYCLYAYYFIKNRLIS